MNSALQGESHFWTKLYMLTSAWGVETIILKRVGDRKKFPHTSQDWTLADKAGLEDKLCSDKYGQEEKLCWDKCGQWLKCVQTKVDRARNCSHPSNSRFSSLTIFSFQMKGENCVQNNLDGKIKCVQINVNKGTRCDQTNMNKEWNCVQTNLKRDSNCSHKRGQEKKLY